MVATKKDSPETDPKTEAKASEITDESPKNEDRSVKGDDTDTSEVETAFAGQILHGEHYEVSTKEVFGRKIVEIKPIGWVGTGLEVSADRVKEIAALIGKVKALPKQD